MRLTQFLVFEATEHCNRAREHWQCPSAHPDRWANTAGRRPMTDAQIVSVAEAMHVGGFHGMIAWHYYCEPLAAWPRLRSLMPRIRERVPQARFLLWTNGDLFPGDLSEFADAFSTIIVTDYAGRGVERLAEICDDVRTVGPGLDWRLNPPTVTPSREPQCIRPFLEIIFDCYGQVRTCCMDWRGDTTIGNIHDTPFDELWERWVKLRDRLASTPMSGHAPLRCLTCGTRYTQLAHYVPEVAVGTLAYLEARCRRSD